MTAVDVIPEKVELINWRKSPIQDEYIEKYLTEKELNLTATLDGAKAYADADFVVIAAPTNYDPVKNYFDTSHVEEVIELMKSVNPCAVMVIKSTIPVGYTESVRRKLDTENVIFSPEFLRESKALGCDSHCRRSSILDDECFDGIFPEFYIVKSCLHLRPHFGFHFEPAARPSFPQALLHFHPCNSFRQEQLWVRVVTVGWQPHSSLDVLSSCWRWAL